MVKTDIRVIYGDTDQMGVVYYANYLRYFEAGRNELLRARGVRYRDLERSHQLFLPVVDAQVSYNSRARYDDLLSVHTDLGRIGRASVRFVYEVVREEASGRVLIASGGTTHACVDGDGQVRPVPESMMAILRGG